MRFEALIFSRLFFGVNEFGGPKSGERKKASICYQSEPQNDARARD